MMGSPYSIYFALLSSLPMLSGFNIFLNDICNNFECEHLLYENDLKFINSLYDCLSLQLFWKKFNGGVPLIVSI